MPKYQRVFFAFLLFAFGFHTPVAAAGPIHDAALQVKVGVFGIKTGLFNTIFAKEICSCMYVDGLTKDECIERDNLPQLAHLLVKIRPSEVKNPETGVVEKTVRSEYNVLVLKAKYLGVKAGPAAVARFISPELGCKLEASPVR